MLKFILSAALFLISLAAFGDSIECKITRSYAETPFAIAVGQSVSIETASANGSAWNQILGTLKIGAKAFQVGAVSHENLANPTVDFWLMPNWSRISLVFDPTLSQAHLIFWPATGETPYRFASAECSNVVLN